MSELRSTTFQLAFDGNDGVTGIRNFTRVVADADETVEALSRQLGENVTVTAKNVASKKELTQEARRLVTQMERNNSKVQEMTRLYQHNIVAVKATSDQQEVLNAVYKLGSTATDKQKKDVAALVTEYQRVRDTTGQVQGSFRNLRGVSQNLGWQLQDVAVQAQMGTSAFVILSQQGSQMASAFGPAGALVGAFIAVAGALAGTVFKSLLKASDGTEKLTEELIKLKETTRLTVSQTGHLVSEEQKVNAERGKSIAQIQKNIDVILWQIKLNEKVLKDYDKQSGTYKNSEKALESLNNKLQKQTSSQQNLLSKMVESGKVFDSYGDKSTKALQSAIKAHEDEAAALGMKGRELALFEALKLTSDSKLNESETARINKAFDLIDAYEKEDLAKKKLKSTTDNLVNAFLSELKVSTKQTETIDQQYERRKSVIDDYVTHIKGSTAQTMSAYEALNIWRENSLDKEFDKLVGNLVKQTSTVETEYASRRKIIDEHVKRTGSIDTEAALAYSNLEQWKTSELSKEYLKREVARQQIEQGQQRQSGLTDSVGAEKNLFDSNLKLLNDQKALLGEEELSELKRIDDLLESEKDRHHARMSELNTESMAAMVGTFSMASNQVTSLVDIMTNGVADVEEKTAEMNGAQKAAFILSQGIAAANALIAGISLGASLAALFPLAAPAMITLGTGIGVANATAIAATTFAGAFDDGGYIPSGQIGITSEYGDELVNGQLVKGPARVTSREDTAKMLNNGGGGSVLSVVVENKIDGASYSVEQLDDNRVKIIAEKVFSENIDKGVAGVINNRNSNANKSLRRTTTARNKF